MNDNELKTILREHDPAAGKSLTAQEVSAMRRRVLAGVPDRPRRGVLRPALAFVVVVGIAIAALIMNRPKTPEPDTAAVTQTVEGSGESTPVEPVAPTHVRQIQYTTEGGTRVIWTLDPDFEL